MEVKEINKSKQYVIVWVIGFVLSLAYYIYYVLNFSSNVPMLDCLLVFVQYYLVFILMSGLLFYFVFKLLHKIPLINILIIMVAHVLFLVLLFHELQNFDSGSFFERAP